MDEVFANARGIGVLYDMATTISRVTRHKQWSQSKDGRGGPKGTVIQEKSGRTSEREDICGVKSVNSSSPVIGDAHALTRCR